MAVLGAGAVTLLGAAAVGSAAPTSVTVVLSAQSATEPVGHAVRLTAKAHGLPAGGHVRILAGRAKVADCARSTCTGTWTGHTAARVSFQAVAIVAGKAVAHSHTVVVTWKKAAQPPEPAPAPAPAPTPPPPPAAPAPLPGHYCGLSNEGKSICFDVTSQPAVANLVTESVATCGNGGQGTITLTISQPVPVVQPGLTMSYSFSSALPDSGGDTNISIAYAISATFDTAGNATGTIVLTHLSFDEGGTHYDCAGDPRTWTARLGA